MSKKKVVEEAPFVVPAEGGQRIPTMMYKDYHRQVSQQQRFVKLPAWKLIARRLYVETFFRGLMDRGATLSFFTLLTTVPTLMAFYAITTLVLDQNRDRIVEITDQFISENIPANFADQARSIIDTIIGSTEQSVITLIISVFIALFSSSAYIRAFSRSANSMYDRHEGRTLVVTWLTMWGLTILQVLGLVMIAVGFFLRDDLVSPLLNSIAQPLSWQGFTDFVQTRFLPVWEFVRWPFIFGLSIVLIALLYHGAPNVRYGRVRWLTTGSVFALVTMTLVALGVRFYLNHFLHIGMYGALGGIIAGFMGLVLINTLLLFGMKIDAEVTRARELQAGMASEMVIQVPPRSSKAADGLNQFDATLAEQAASFRKAYGDPHPPSIAASRADAGLSSTSQEQSSADPKDKSRDAAH